MEVLDNLNYLKQRDPADALSVAANEWQQLTQDIPLELHNEQDLTISQIVVTGMGGSALAAGMAKDWLNLSVPFEVSRNYDLPAYVGPQTLVIASSYSGNTEETRSSLEQAMSRGARVAVIASGGALVETARQQQLTCAQLAAGLQPRMAVLANLRALLQILHAYDLVNKRALDEFAAAQDFLARSSRAWLADVSGRENLAKQIAWACAGKTPVVYAGQLFGAVAYKWKISFNENAKNVAFCNVLPEFNHNEFMGWSSHPIQKPYAVIDLTSSHDHPQITKRFEVSDRLLSGMRPHSTTVPLGGETILEQMLWGSVLADFVSIYLAILNGVDPTPVDLIEKLKVELA